MNLTKHLLSRLGDRAWVKAAVARARKLTGGPNACAATLSQFLIDAGVIAKPETWTASLVGNENEAGRVERLRPMKRINHPADMRAGDIGVTMDRNANDAPDHVFLMYGNPQGMKALVIDNYCRNGKPYWRNLGAGRKTPLSYGLRFIDVTADAHDYTGMFASICAIFDDPEFRSLPDPTRVAIKQLRQMTPFGEMTREG